MSDFDTSKQNSLPYYGNNTENKNFIDNKRESDYTECSSKTDFSYKNNGNKYNKKSVECFPSKMNINEDQNISNLTKVRKYSMEPKLFIRDFVPKIKPIEIHLVPSKLRLNHKGFKDLKINSNNILVQTNSIFRSCPNSSESDYDLSFENQSSDRNDNDKDLKDSNDNGEKENNNILIFPSKTRSPHRSLKFTRKYLQKMKMTKGKMSKVSSKNDCRIEKYDNQIKFESSCDEKALFDQIYDESDYNEKYEIECENNENNEKKDNKEFKEYESGDDEEECKGECKEDMLKKCESKNFSSEKSDNEGDINSNKNVNEINNINDNKEEDSDIDDDLDAKEDVNKFRRAIKFNNKKSVKNSIKNLNDLGEIEEEKYGISNKKYNSNTEFKLKKLSNDNVRKMTCSLHMKNFHRSTKNTQIKRPRGLSFSILDILQRSIKFNNEEN